MLVWCAVVLGIRGVLAVDIALEHQDGRGH
jgi:hypothetical protein